MVTKDKLRAWGISDSTSFEFCGSGSDTIHHLLADCHFYKDVWNEILYRNQLYRTMGNWQDEVNAAVQMAHGSPFMLKIRTLAFSTTVYCL